MEDIYGIVSSCEDYADKALLSPENLMAINPSEFNVSDHYYHYYHYPQSDLSNNLSSTDHQYEMNYPPVFGANGFHCGFLSESASINVENEYSSSIKAKIASHPLYPQLVSAYVECQKVGAPPEVTSLLDEIRRDKSFCKNEEAVSMAAVGADPELDEFMERFCEVLTKYKSDLSRPFDEASSFLDKMERKLNNIDKEVAAAISSDEEELSGGGETETPDDHPLTPPKSSEDGGDLKNKLLVMYGGHISSLKQEFSKKKKKGKLPKESRQILLQWWNAHFKWPYPTEADKISLGELTGLDQKQINNWFINQRKRHWKPSEDMQLNYFMD